MWIDEGWRALPRFLVALGVVALAACGGGDAPEAADTGAPTGGAETAAAPAPEAAPVTNVADLFPEDPAKPLVLSNCSTCHAVACSVIGQRPESRWRELAEAHREHVPSLSDEDRDRIFAYLAANFNESRPEPMVPPELIQAGCTPF